METINFASFCKTNPHRDERWSERRGFAMNFLLQYANRKDEFSLQYNKWIKFNFESDHPSVCRAVNPMAYIKSPQDRAIVLFTAEKNQNYAQDNAMNSILVLKHIYAPCKVYQLNIIKEFPKEWIVHRAHSIDHFINYPMDFKIFSPTEKQIKEVNERKNNAKS